MLTALKDEQLRLRLLKDLEILDTPLEQDFQDLVQLAAAICDAPISLVSLLDEDRQWFKARVGLDLAQTPRHLAFCAHAILQDDLFVVPNAREDIRFADNDLVLDEPHICFYAGYPLKSDEGVALGTLCVIDRRPRELTLVQKEALRVLARQVMMQLMLRRKVKAIDAAVRERDESARALRLSESRITAFMDASPAATFIKDEHGRMTYCNYALTRLYGAKPSDWIGRYDNEIWPASPAAKFREADLRVLHSGKMMNFHDEMPREGERPLQWNVFKFPFQDAAGNNYVAGVAIDVTREREAESELRSYQAELQRLNEQLTLLSVTDGLTLVKNRRAFDESLAYECARAQRSHSPLSLLMLDIDCFKTFNDTFGHVCGDEVLRVVATLLKGCVRSTDFVARYGGEEFAVILPDAPEYEAFHLATRICEIIEEADWEYRPITVSIGVGSLHPQMKTASSFVEFVDRALYNAKRLGKNQASLQAMRTSGRSVPA